MNSDLYARISRRISQIEIAGAKRSLAAPRGIDLSSNDYLGLSQHPTIKKRMAEAAIDQGCGSTGSRLLRGEREVFSYLEKRFARFKGTETALYFGSGYAANLGVLATFLEAGDVVFSDELNHASLIDGIRLSRAERRIFKHCDLEALRRMILAEKAPGQKFLVTESLFSMDGDTAPLKQYAELCDETGTALIIDEAHAVGIYGEHGSGLIEETGIADCVFLSINPAGKALGVSGAFVSGPRWAIDYLIQQARTFIFSTAPPPPVAAALDEALTVIETEPERRETLKQYSNYLRNELIALGIALPPGESQIIPIIIGDNERAVSFASAIQEAGFDVRPIRPPTVPPGTARLRISVNTKLAKADLDRFASVLAEAIGNKAKAAV